MKQIIFFGIILWASLTAMAQPIITQPPANQTLALGDTLTLNVTTGGTTPAYQWFKDMRLLVGATNSTLTIANAGVTNSGTYYVVVTNSGGIVISLPALVTVGNTSLQSWGYNRYGQLGNGTTSSTNTPISVAGNVVAGAAGQFHSLYVTADGTLWAMGDNVVGQLGNYANLTSSKPNPTPMNIAGNVVAVAAGQYHSLFVTADGTLWAMGYDNYGQLGNGLVSNAGFPTPVSVASNVVAVAAGQWHSLFLKADGTLCGMGNNGYGQLGNGTTASTNLPIVIASNVVAVAAGSYHTLFMKADGTLWTMGYNGSGQFGNGTTNNSTTPISVASNVVAVAAGGGHSLFVITDGTLWAMGANTYGQLGNGTTVNTNRPVCVASNVITMAGGSGHSLFTKTDGTLWAMGYNADGELGNGTTVNTNRPVCVTQNTVANVFPADQASHSLSIVNNYNALLSLSGLNQTYSGSTISATASTIPPGLTVNLTYNGSPDAPTNAGRYVVAGTVSDPNYYASATNIMVITPAGLANQTVAPGGTLTLAAVAGGTGQSYQWLKDSRMIVGATNSTLTIANAGLTNSGMYSLVVTNMSGTVISLPVLVSVGNPSLLAWGYNNYGQLGNGTTINSTTPINVASNVVAGAAGYEHSLFVDTNGTLWAMGYNNYGQLGNGTTNNSATPVRVASNVVAVAAGYYHTLFVDTNGTLWAMGNNQAGQLGNGMSSNTNRPVSVASNVVAVAAGMGHSLFLTTDGTLRGMGSNFYGGLGNGSSVAQSPINVASNVVAVAAGEYHSLFLKTDGTLWAMGWNAWNQLGNGSSTDAHSPINVASNVVAVAAGYQHSLFVDTNGTLWGMGHNYWSIPASVTSNVVAVAAGEYHSVFTKTDGTLWVSGQNNYGQLGNGTYNDVLNWTPISLPQLVVANVFPADEAYHSLAIGYIKSSATVTLDNLNQLFTGGAISANASTTPSGLTVNLTYNGSPNAPTNAGNYSVIGVISDPNYYGIATNTLVISPNATVTLTNLSQLYTGSAISVTASTTPPGLTVNLTYNGSPNAPTNAGNYTVIGVISDPNYYGIASDMLVVGQSPQSFGIGSTNSQQLTLQLTGTPNYPYILESATNLTPPVVWLPVFTNYADTNGIWSYTITGLTNFPAGYYRAVAQ